MPTTDELFEIGQIPPEGIVPEYMYAQTIRRERFGEPIDAFKQEIVKTPAIGDDEILVYVMTAGINYNNVWAASGKPIDVIGLHENANPDEDFHIGGSDGAGIVWAVGKNVKSLKIGDEVILCCGVYNDREAGIDLNNPQLSRSYKIWGYETNWGSFAQFTKVRELQCVKKPQDMSWIDAGAFMLTAATAYRMLCSWLPNSVKDDVPVLIWGGSGGLGSMAIQITKALGGLPVSVVSSEEKSQWCLEKGAIGNLIRVNYDHWGSMPDFESEDFLSWRISAKKFLHDFYEQVGSRKSPQIVLEHPGQDTMATSLFVCSPGGMVVTCGGSSGYQCDFDVRYLWMFQKRIQGSHFASRQECIDILNLISTGKVSPCVSKVYEFDKVNLAHQSLKDNSALGNQAVLINLKP